MSKPDVKESLTAQNGAAAGSVLDDAKRLEISMSGQALLQWGFSDGKFARWSLQMPEEVVDQILAWRDQSQNLKD